MRRTLHCFVAVAALFAALAVLQAPAPAGAAAPAITATKTDTLLTDADSSGNASPGDTLRYTVTVQNTGDSNATNTVFNDTIDGGTTLVPGTFQTTPLARNDSYSTVGNVQLTVPVATGVLLNDSDPDGSGGLSVASYNPTSTNGGNVSASTNGSFTYNPPPGFSGTDTFTYTATDGEGNTNGATVSITVGQVVWFINNAVGSSGDGRFTSPFNSVANFNALAADDVSDTIFVYQGSGAYGDTFTLLNSQRLIGHGAGLSLSPNLAIAAASRPTISNVVLDARNTVKGLNVSTTTGTGVSGASVGELRISDVSVTNTGGIGVSLSGGSSNMAVAFDSVSSSGGANGIALTNNAGSFSASGGTIDPTTGHGVAVSQSTAGPLDLTLQNMTVTGAPAGFNGVNLAIPTAGSLGNVRISSNTISNNGLNGVLADVGGTGSIGKLEVAANTFTGNSTGVNLSSNGTGSVDFDVHDNPTISGSRSQVRITANDDVPLDGAGPTMEGYVRGNTLTSDPAQLSITLWVVSDGDGDITTDINSNVVSGFGDTGIDVESQGGTGDVNARIANNTATTTKVNGLSGTFLRAGKGTDGETNLLCANLAGNSVNGGSGTIADYYLDRFNDASTVFQLQGLSPSPATPAQAQAYVLSTDSAPPASAYVEFGTYTAATCAAVSFSPASLAAAARGALAAKPVQPGLVKTAGTGLAPHAAITPGSLGTLNPSETITITFDVTINASFTGSSVSNQGHLTADGGLFVLTDDPDTVSPNDPTVTPVTVVREAPTISGTPPDGRVGQAYSFTFTTTGVPTPAISRSGALPVGITLIDNGNGTARLSGTPAASGTFSFTLTASNGVAPDASLPVTLEINAPPTLSGEPPDGEVGVAYSAAFTVTGHPTPTVTKTTGTLPPGLTVGTDGSLTGTPTTAGNFTFTLEANNGVVPHAVHMTTVKITATPPTLSGDPPDGEVGVAYSATFTVTGSPTPTVTKTTGTLPPGLTLGSDGSLTGTPTTAGSYTFTVVADNGVDPAATHTTTVEIDDGPMITGTPPDGRKGQAYSYTFTATGHPTPTVTHDTGTLPAGLGLASDGTLSGTPTAVGTYRFTVEADNGVGPAARLEVTVVIRSSPTIGGTPPAGGVGEPYSFQFTRTGFPAPTVTRSAGTLPPGLSLTTDGRLQGTPTQAGTFTFTVQAANGVGTAATKQVTVVIRSRPSLRIIDATIAEGNSGTRALAFRVTLSRASTVPITVKWSTANSSAVAGSDFVAVSNLTLTFAPGQTSKTVNVLIKGDRVKEPNESFVVTMFTPTNATIGDSNATAVIRNDD